MLSKGLLGFAVPDNQPSMPAHYNYNQFCSWTQPHLQRNADTEAELAPVTKRYNCKACTTAILTLVTRLSEYRTLTVTLTSLLTYLLIYLLIYILAYLCAASHTPERS